MKNLNIRISIKIIESNSKKKEKKRMTIKDMTKMNLVEMDKNINEMKQSIEKGETDEYTIDIFTTLCGKAIEELNKSFDKEADEKQTKYQKMMEDVYKLEKIDEFNKNEINDKNSLDGINKDKIEDKNGVGGDIIEENKNEIIKEDKIENDINEIKENDENINKIEDN